MTLVRTVPLSPDRPTPQPPLLELPRAPGRRTGAQRAAHVATPQPSSPPPRPVLREQLVDEVLLASAVVVTRIDTPGEGTKARWYRIGLQPALDGGIDVVRAWGRLPVGEHPRRLLTSHATMDEASMALRAVVDRRLRRGYQPRPPTGHGGRR